MLGYELYLKNKKNIKRIVNTRFPVKKVYCYNNSVELDAQTSTDYDSDESEQGFSELQTILSAPLNDSDETKLNLPDQSRGTNTTPNFVKLLGSFQTTKNEIKMELTTARPKSFSAKYISNNQEILFNAEGKLPLRLELTNYLIGEITFLNAYIDSGIINTELEFDSTLFKKISNKIFDFASTKIPNITQRAGLKQKFEVYVLPNHNAITVSNKKSNESFIDSFGNIGTQYSEKPTRTASFFSCNDRAFTVNERGIKQRDVFYKDLGISEESLEKIEINDSDGFFIGGLNWIFSNISKGDYQFKKSSGGIFNRLYDNYRQLNNEGNPKYLSQMKIICYHKSRKQFEVLIDENMTMDSMTELFVNKFAEKVPRNVLEVLIMENKNKKRNFYGQYIQAVRTLVIGHKIEKHQLIPYLTKLVHTKIHSEKWMSENISKGNDFFKRSWDCLKILSRCYDENNLMNPNEEFAYKIGLIAGKYVRFREQEKDNPKSVRDILIYNKYDAEKLKFVYKKVCLGVNLSNQESQLQSIREYINKNNPGDIDNTNLDLSYFFYNGVFKNLGGSNDES